MSDRSTTLRSAGQERSTLPRRPAELAAGTEVGRYVILGVVGVGGFGIVYRAYDPELDRSVALKHFSESARGSSRAGRVLREARALAKLRHPNIVAVYDAGEHDGRAFVAMEYVSGSNLDLWLHQEERAWPLTAKLFAHAAAGLDAAHSAGIIHRDFKPQNVLVSPDGVAYVADFGLAVAGVEATGTAADKRPPGTPAYLAPELYTGEPATVRSDVYSYCVTLWQAAFTERPWGATVESALVEEKLEGPPPLPKPGVLPRGLARLVTAGLDPNPEARPPSLAEFVAALSERGGGGKRWFLAAALAAAGVGVGVLAPSDDAPCREAAAALDAVWNDEVRAGLQQQISGSSGPRGEETWARVERGIERWQGRWRSQRVDACEATHVRKEQSEALLDRRGRCFDRELQTLSALLVVLKSADEKVYVRAPRAIEKLAAEPDCSLAAIDVDAELESPQQLQLRTDLDRIKVLETVALYDEGLRLCDEVEAQARAQQSFEIGLRAKHRRGRLLHATGKRDEAVAIYTEVHWDAEARGIDDLAARAGLDAMFEYAAPLGQPKVALEWQPHVAAAVRRAGDDPRLQANLADNRGLALLYSHDLPAALEAHKEALVLRESYESQGLDTVATLQNLGIVYEELTRYDDAIASHRSAYAILERLLGDEHPDTARVRDNLGAAQLRSGDIAAAIENFRFALGVRRSVLGPQHPSVALSYMHLGIAALEQSDGPGAVAEYAAALEILKEVQPSSPNITLCHEGLAHAHRIAGDASEARTYAETALKGFEGLLPDDHRQVLGLRAILDAHAP